MHNFRSHKCSKYLSICYSGTNDTISIISVYTQYQCTINRHWCYSLRGSSPYFMYFYRNCNTMISPLNSYIIFIWHRWSRCCYHRWSHCQQLPGVQWDCCRVNLSVMHCRRSMEIVDDTEGAILWSPGRWQICWWTLQCLHRYSCLRNFLAYQST